MNAQNTSPMPTEIIYRKLADTVKNYVDRTPVANGPEQLKKLIAAIQSRRMYMMTQPIHFVSLWEEEIGHTPEFVDFFMTVAADFSFSITTDQDYCGEWHAIAINAANSFDVYKTGDGFAILDLNLGERLLSGRANVKQIFLNNHWLVVYTLLQRLPLATLTAALSGWYSLPAEEKKE